MHLLFASTSSLLKAKSLHSIKANFGMIVIAYLNLPSTVHYKSENLYLARIITSFNKPKIKYVNHYMYPLVDDLVVSWKVRVYFSEISLCPHS